MSAAASPTTRSDDSLNEFLLAAMTPILVGSIISVLVYVSIPYLPVPQEAAERYLAQSPVQKVIVWLFCAGISSVFLRAFRLRAAYQALGLAPLTTFPLAGADDLQILDRARTELAGLPRRIQRTPLVRRLTQVIGWMLARRSVAGIEGQLKQRAEAAQLRQHERIAGVRLSSWGMMLLGFVGTIGGLATAIAKVPADEVTSAVAMLTGGLLHLQAQHHFGRVAFANRTLGLGVLRAQRLVGFGLHIQRLASATDRTDRRRHLVGGTGDVANRRIQ